MTYLLDTNVLVYSLDAQEPVKLERAREVLEHLVEFGKAALSSQALSEFASVTLRKLRFTPEQSYRQVERFELLFPVYPLTSALVLEALRGVKDHRFSYYDAQVWATAKLHQLPVVLSEDFPSGSTVEGVTFLNPFADAFDLTMLG